MIELDVIDGAASEAPANGSSDEPGTRFWRSYGDLRKDPATQKIAQNEFMQGAADPPTKSSRRTFLKLSGALMAMAGLTACRRPESHILPYARKPEEVIPGVPLFYSTAMPFRGVGRGLLVESHEGRPTKAEGNPEHPAMQGATGGFEQASVLNLYDPDRSRRVLREGSEASWSDFVNFVPEFTAGAGAKTIAVLAEDAGSPTLQAVREKLEQRFGSVRWIPYTPEGDDAAVRGMQQAYGRPLRPQYDFSEADVIVSLDADFLSGTNPNFVADTRTFAASRRLSGPDDTMSRLYVAESGFSLTGGQADNRLRLQARRVTALAAALASELGAGSAPSGASLSEREQMFVREMARDLQEAGSRGVALAGETQPPAVHALCAAINGQLGSEAFRLLDTGREPTDPQPQQLAQLVRDMRGGQVDGLVMIGANPVYDLPPEMGFAEAMQSVDQTIHLGTHIDETAQRSRWHLPRTHYLEQWGDVRAFDGTVSLIQPLIQPLYDDAHSDIEALNLLATGLDAAGYDLVRAAWREQLSGTFEQEWRRLLHDGFQPNSAYPEVSAGGASAPGLGALQAPQEDEIELVFRLDPALLAGEYANNAWMQELPDPTTKIVWDNVAIMSQQTAQDLGLSVEYSTGQYYVDVIQIQRGEHAIELPVWIQPGYPDGTIGLAMGYGRNLESLRAEPDGSLFDFAKAYEGIYEQDEPLANGVGTNVAPLRSPQLERVAVIPKSNIQKTGGDYMIASTQEHGSMEGRPIVRRASMEAYRDNPDFAPDAVHTLPGGEDWDEYPTLWQDDHPSDQPALVDSDYYQNQWGMVIDLNTCTGCNACIVACNSENNVQVVGKDQVSRGREMHWLRLDRYFVADNPDATTSGHGEQDEAVAELGAMDEDAIGMVVQPVMCQHCENAPCESVCPVAATVHSPDGTNQMVYNRCIGTRYCSNNCPYKVRRFNFYNWTESLPTEVQMAQNPNVSVRFRGVMEKCSWCIHRVRETQSRADNEDRNLEDGEVLTACQQACPAEAITFGDLNDPNSQVSQLKQHDRDYTMLAELNVKPRLSYLGRVSNPNPRLTQHAYADGEAHAEEA